MSNPKTGCRLEGLTGLTPLAATTNCPDPEAAYERLFKGGRVPLYMKLPPDLNALLDREARAEGMSRPQAVIQILEMYFDEKFAMPGGSGDRP